VGELARPFAMSGPAVTKHLKVLERAGLISRGRAAQQRPAKLEPAALKAASEWLQAYRRFWDEKFDDLDAYLTRLQTEGEQK
jgi:DNA-binding transcriptional ArsR family regulator